MQVIAVETARSVAALMHEVLLPHQLRADAVMFSTAQTGHARWIAGYILSHRSDRITVRDIVRAYRPLSASETRNELAAVMDSLTTVDWVEPEPTANPAKSISSWRINPLVYVNYAAKAERERQAREQTKAAIAASVEVLRRQQRH